MFHDVGGSFRIKVCGITSEEAARTAIEAGADHLGLVLCPSVRRVDPERAAAIVDAVRGSWVAVLADPSPDDAARIAERLRLSAIQLHGRERPETCREIRARAGIPVWKALDGGGRIELGDWADAADAVVLDRGAGGGGLPLDWIELAARLSRADRALPVILAGGLSAENVARAIETVRPDGVDASSGLETAPGVKDPERIRAFVRRARAASGAPASAESTP